MGFIMNFDTVSKKFAKLFNSRVARYGFPFVILVVGGSIGLRQFTSLKFLRKRQQTLTRDEAKEMGISMKKPEEVTLDTTYEKVKDLDIDNWENKRIPRVWEPAELTSK